MLKWPNDLVVAGGKIGGILCEAQMRGSEGIVIVGVGMNVRAFPLALEERRDLPATFLGPHLRPGTTRLDLLEAIVRELRRAVHNPGEELSTSEMGEYTDRDWLRGRTLAAPVAGIASGITLNGQLRVAGSDGYVTTVVSGRVGLA
jgi:BirA family biotin operon repressor/biotin-[acetyl-CoA-carboxylase] ligase